jgi:hypothetical protein
VLFSRKHQGDVNDDAGGGEWLQCVDSGRSRRNFDHAITVAGRPFLAEFNVSLDSFCVTELRCVIVD